MIEIIDAMLTPLGLLILCAIFALGIVFGMFVQENNEKNGM